MDDVTNLNGSGIEFVSDANDLPNFADQTILRGFGVEFVQQGDDIRVNDTTTIRGFAIEYVDRKLNTSEIITRRL